MKKLVLLSFVGLLFMACKQEPQRYFAESAEIETVKSGINSYENADWEKWHSNHADTAKFYVNSTKSITASERLEELKQMTSAMSSYGFNHDKEYIEMVLDKEDETWVYYWASHNATFAANGEQVTMPVHLAIRFIDGKIVEEHVVFDSYPLVSGLQKIEAAKAAAEAEAQTEEENAEM